LVDPFESYDELSDVKEWEYNKINQ
jgi:hypothetical protein